METDGGDLCDASPPECGLEFSPFSSGVLRASASLRLSAIFSGNSNSTVCFSRTQTPAHGNMGYSMGLCNDTGSTWQRGRCHALVLCPNVPKPALRA